MAIGGPRVGKFDPFGEMTMSRAGCSPKPEGSIHMDPSPGLMGERDDLREWIERTGVQITGLQQDDGGLCGSGSQHRGQGGVVDKRTENLSPAFYFS